MPSKQQQYTDMPDVTNIEQADKLVLASQERYYEEAHKGIELPLDFLPTLSQSIDGLSRGELVIVGARPSNGKSIFCIQLSLSLALQGKKVHFCSLEMTKKSCIDRIVSNLSGTSTQDIKKMIVSGQLQKSTDLISECYQQLLDKQLTFSDSIGSTWRHIDFLVKNMKGLDVLVLDYIQMVKGQDQMKKEAIDEYIKKMREYAIRKNICIVLASQINRNGAGEVPKMHEMKSTGCLEEVADKVFLLHYPFFYSKDLEQKNEYVVRLEKNRQGSTAHINSVVYPELCQIKECLSVKQY